MLECLACRLASVRDLKPPPDVRPLYAIAVVMVAYNLLFEAIYRGRTRPPAAKVREYIRKQEMEDERLNQLQMFK